MKDVYDTESFPVDVRADSFIAEQEALLQVVRSVMRKAVKGNKVLILSDSLSNLASIQSPGNRDQKESQIKKELKKACEAGVEVTLQHVKGHSGILGNEIADYEAGVKMEEVRNKAEPLKVLKSVARSITSTRVRQQAKKRWSAIAGVEADLGGLGRHRKRMGGIRGNPTLKKGTRGIFTRRNEVVYNHMRLGQPIVLSENDRDNRNIRKVWSCACHGAGKWRKGVEHILFQCPEYSVEREKMKKLVEKEEEDAKRATLEKGLVWWGGSWGRLKMIDQHPIAAMGFIADALGSGYGRSKEELDMKKGSGKGLGKGSRKGSGKGLMNEELDMGEGAGKGLGKGSSIGLGKGLKKKTTVEML